MIDRVTGAAHSSRAVRGCLTRCSAWPAWPGLRVYKVRLAEALTCNSPRGRCRRRRCSAVPLGAAAGVCIGENDAVDRALPELRPRERRRPGHERLRELAGVDLGGRALVAEPLQPPQHRQPIAAMPIGQTTGDAGGVMGANVLGAPMGRLPNLGTDGVMLRGQQCNGRVQVVARHAGDAA